MKYIPLKRAAEECTTALEEFVNGDKYKEVSHIHFMREIKQILESGLKNEAVRRKKLKDE